MSFYPEEAATIFEQGGTPRDVVDAAIKTHIGTPVAPRTARRWHKQWQDKNLVGVLREEDDLTDELHGLRELIRDKRWAVEDLSTKLDRSSISVQRMLEQLEAKGHNIVWDREEVYINTKISVRPPDPLPNYAVDSQIFQFGVITDTHCGSKEEQISAMRHFLNLARERGITKFFHVGDLVAGQGVYAGQDLELYAYTAEEQAEAYVRNCAPLSGEDWYILGGNHDFAWLKRGRTDVVWQICRRYDNLHYMGYDLADVPLTDKVSLRMWHPSGGVPYSTSYRLQKGMETLAFEQLVSKVGSEDKTVRILLAGHLHVDNCMQRGALFAAQCACFEGRTSYLARKGLQPEIGGYIYTLYLNDAGDIHHTTRDYYAYPEVREEYVHFPLENPVQIKEVTYVYMQP